MNIQNFSFNNQSLQIIIKDNQAWFIASEVANLLGYLKASDLTRILDDDEKGTHNMRTLGGNQDVSIINESGFYHAAFKSRKPEVKPFRKWVTNEVLPSIRQTGSYQPSAAPAAVTRLTPTERNRLRAAVRGLSQHSGETTQSIYIRLFAAFGIAALDDLPRPRFAEALGFLQGGAHQAASGAVPLTSIVRLLLLSERMRIFARHYALAFRQLGIDPDGRAWSFAFDAEPVFRAVRDYCAAELPRAAQTDRDAQRLLPYWQHDLSALH